MSKPFCITFAGAVGSGKTPIATYLSHNLNLPVFNNDALRSEILEDFGEWNEEEYLSRRNSRFKNILQSDNSFIFDVSVDRSWDILSEWLHTYNYIHFIISLNLSEDFLERLYDSKGYSESIKRLRKLIEDHQKFLNEYEDIVNLHIDDTTFPNRLKLSKTAVTEWLNSGK